MKYFFTRKVKTDPAKPEPEAAPESDLNALNFPQIQYCITFLSHLKEYFEPSWPYDMNGSRILIALNHNSNSCAIKLVDKSKSEQKIKGEKDQSFADGLASIINILQTFMFTYEYKQSLLKKELSKAQERFQSIKTLDETPTERLEEEVEVKVVLCEEPKASAREQPEAEVNTARKQRPRRWHSILQGYDIGSVEHIQQECQTPSANPNELTNIDFEAVSNCFSEDEEIV